MLIATPSADQFRVVDAYSKSVRLGIDLERTGSLSRRAINRTVSALQTCAEKLAAYGVVHTKFVATEACRRAENGIGFLEEVREQTGLELEIIRPSEEARLAVISCASLVGHDAEQALIVDIGGGSTELVWIDLEGVPPDARAAAIMRIRPTHKNKGAPVAQGEARVVDWISVPTGVATLYEKYRDVDDDTARFALMSWYFEEQIQDFKPYRDEAFFGDLEGFQVIGTSGTVTTVGAAHLGLQRYDRSKVDGMQMRSDEVDAVVSQFLQLGPEGRRTHPGIGRDRTRLIMAGAAIFQTLLRAWPTDCIRVADRGLREGLLYSMMSENGVLNG
jgi:exopolyphosphatase/guanosine-5'-triphosphate,3'-diphosphate pyrophosphatase